MSLFKELVLDSVGSAKDKPGIPFHYSGKLGKYLDSIQQERMYTIGGRESGGKRSFTDMHFLLGAYLSWYTIPEEKRPPLKILYFNMDKPLKQKMQKWLCAYMWLAYGEFMDINTLNGNNSRLYDIDDELLKKLEQSQLFFDTMIENDVLHIFNGPRNPTGINSDIAHVMNEYGNLYKEKFKAAEFEFHEQYENMITIVIIDNVRKLNGESSDGQRLNEYQLNETMVGYLESLKRTYKITPVVIVPTTKVSGITLKKDMLPDFREFNVYYNPSDVAINCFNPHAYIESTTNWKGYELNQFVTSPDRIGRLRTVHIMRNQHGTDNLALPYVMFPENGIFEEAMLPDDRGFLNYVENLKAYKQNLITTKNSVA